MSADREPPGNEEINKQINSDKELDVNTALEFIQELLSERKNSLNDLQIAVFRGSWRGLDYKEIYQEICRQYPDRSYERSYIAQDVGPKLWKRLETVLSDVLGEPVKVGKKLLREPISKAREKRSDLIHPLPPANSRHPPALPSSALPALPSPFPVSFEEIPLPTWAFTLTNVNVRFDWQPPPRNPSSFCGRESELKRLKTWIVLEDCNLVVLFGLPKTGKTALAFRLAQDVKDQFDFVIGRSLHHWKPRHSRHLSDQPPSLSDLVCDLNQVLSNSQDSSSDPWNLFEYLTRSRCLVILDGFEAVLRPGVHDSSYRPGYEDYDGFLRQIGETSSLGHSCLLLTSRELPKAIVEMDAWCSAVHQSMLKGLSEDAALSLCLAGAPDPYPGSPLTPLIRCCAGNPYLLHQVARIIQPEHSGGSDSMDQATQDDLLRSEITNLLRESIDRLSPLERSCIQTICRLANHGEFATIANIRRHLSQNPPSLVSPDTSILEALSSLGRRSLLQPIPGRYDLNRLVMEYAMAWMMEADVQTSGG
jgi:hypothetical protein